MDKTADTTPKGLERLPLQPQLKADLTEVIRKQIALIFIDLDHFKEVNDRMGHAAGDTCLAKVVDVIEGVVAGRGTLYRYGGDEFAVILDNADVDEGAATAERIRSSVQKAAAGGQIEVTASIGVASSDTPDLDDVAKLIDAADQAMYESKRLGKNRVSKCVAGERPLVQQRTSREEQIRRLIDLAEHATHRLQNDSQVGEAIHLHANVKQWEDDVVQALTAAGALESDISWFRVLGTYTSQNLAGRTPYHKKVRNEVAEKIGRLRSITRGLEEGRRR